MYPQISKTEQTKEKHLNAYQWKPGEIPLGIWVNDKSKHKKINYGAPDFHKLLFERQMRILEDTISVGSDIVPVLGIKNYPVVVPTIFGAVLKDPGFDIDRIEEVGFWVEKRFEDFSEVMGLDTPAIDSSLLSDMLEQLQYYRTNAPSWAELSTMILGPFSTAELLRGGDMYTDLYDHPVCVHKLMDLCTEVIIKCMKLFRKTSGYEETVQYACTPFGMWYPGLRFGDDSIINLSPRMIQEFVVPYYEKIARSFGCSIEIHFCSTPALMGDQILEGLSGSQYIKGISTQLGTLHYEKNIGKIKNKISVEAAYGNAISYFTERYGSFRKWASALKKQYADTSGLVLYTEAASVEEGKRLLDEWVSA